MEYDITYMILRRIDKMAYDITYMSCLAMKLKIIIQVLCLTLVLVLVLVQYFGNELGN